jgi:hypothetical protein
MSVERLLAAGLLAVTVVLLVRVLPHSVRVWQTYAGTSQRRQEDVTASAPEPEQDTAERVAILGALGYHQIGATRTVMPLGAQYGRIMAADDGAPYVIVADSPRSTPGLTGIYTSWPDGTWVGTIHPSGDPHQRPGLQLSVISGSLEDAVTAHRAAVELMRRAHGGPRPVARMADVLALDADYRQRFGGRELRPLLVRALAPTVVYLALMIISLYVVLAVR